MALDPAPIAARLKAMFQANTAIMDSEDAIDATSLGIAQEIAAVLPSPVLPPWFVVGGYLTPLLSSPVVSSTFTLNAGRIHFVPFYCPSELTVDEIAIHILSSSPSTDVKLGIYTEEGGYPKDLLLETSPVTASSGGKLAVSLASVVISSGMYFFAIEVSSTLNNVRYVSGGTFSIVYTPDSHATQMTNYAVHTLPSSFGPFPSTVSPGSIVRISIAFCPMFWIRINSIA